MQRWLLVWVVCAGCGATPAIYPATDAGFAFGSDAGPHDGGALSTGEDAGSALPGPDAGAEPHDAGPPVAITDGGAPPPRPSGPYPRNGWPVATAPNGRVLGLDLAQAEEDTLLHADGTAALYAVAAGPDAYHADHEPLILVHGIQGTPADLQSVVDRFWSSRYQLYVLAYNDYYRRTSLNGLDLAAELRSLELRLSGAGRNLVFVAHSLGGIVVRQALDELAAGPAGGLDRFERVRFFGVDNPWHGFDGPADGPLMDIARPFMPDGIEDMRALSAMFQGDPSSSDPALRAGLLNVELPSSVSILLVFAETGTLVLDYTEGVVAQLPGKLVALYLDLAPVTGEAQLINFWNAIRTANGFAAVDAELQARAAAGTIDEAAAMAALRREFPKFPGDHSGVLAEHPGQHSLLDYLTEQLTP